MRKANGLLKDLRHTLGLTQEGLVDRLREYLMAEGINAALDIRSIGSWESGAVRWPHPHYRAALRAVLGVDDDAALGFHLRSAGTPPRVLMQVLDPDTEDPMKRQTFMTGLASVALGAANGQPLQPWLAMERSHSIKPTLIGVADVQAIQRTAEQFSAWDHSRGGESSADAVLGQLNWAATLLDQGRFATTHVRAQLSSAVSYLAQVAGRSAYDAGLRAQARRALTLAVHAATEADDQPLRAFALTNMARQAIRSGQPGQGLDLITLASSGLTDRSSHSTDTPAPLRSLVQVITARAHAGAGHTQAVLDNVSAAEDSYAPPGSDDPGWLRYYSSAELAGETGAAIHDAAEHRPSLHGQAVQRLTVAAADYGPAYPRSAAFCRARVAALHLDAGDLEPALDHAHTFITVAEGIGSARVREYRAMLAQHARPHLDVPAVADLVHTLQAS
jgi:hypothetical protein